jgi:ATP phosphoribosyltransferase
MGSEVADGRMSFCVPSKGALADGTVSLFRNCLIPLKRTRGERSYEARLAGMDDVDVQLVRPADVPYLVESGQALAGITGLDLVREHRGSGSSDVQEVLTDLDFGSADLVVGVPVSWLDVSSIDDLVDVAQEVRHKHGRALRVATKFSNLTRDYLREHGLVDFRLVESLGATEGAPGLVRPTSSST